MLSEFRTRLVEGRAELLLLDTLLLHLQQQGLVRARGRGRTDSAHVLAAVRVLNRLERIGETLRAALNELATVAPDWLQALAAPAWYERNGRRVENYRSPKAEAARSALVAEIGAPTAGTCWTPSTPPRAGRSWQSCRWPKCCAKFGRRSI